MPTYVIVEKHCIHLYNLEKQKLSSLEKNIKKQINKQKKENPAKKTCYPFEYAIIKDTVMYDIDLMPP